MPESGPTPLAEEMRRCTEIRCGHEMTVGIHHGEPTEDDLEQQFYTLGWRGYFCPVHAHLARSGRGV